MTEKQARTQRVVSFFNGIDSQRYNKGETKPLFCFFPTMKVGLGQWSVTSVSLVGIFLVIWPMYNDN